MIPLFTALALIILGFFFIAATLWSLVSAEASRSWPSTQGTIAQSRTREEIPQTHYGRGIIYVPEISYTYSVGERLYKGDRISFGTPGWKSKEKACAWVDQHRAGASVEVYYDPAEPGNSVLETNARGSWGYALVGLVWWIFAAMILAIRPH